MNNFELSMGQFQLVSDVLSMAIAAMLASFIFFVLVRQQMLREAAVAPEPEPVIEVQSDPGGTLSVQVRYADAETAEARMLTVQIPG